MKRKKITLKIQEYEIDEISIKSVNVTKEGGEYVFEIGNESTSDVAEAVSMLMRIIDWSDPIWNMEVNRNLIHITPEKSLFWLSGGYNEWNTLSNYNRKWCDCYQEFKDEFGEQILNIVSNSKTLLDIRNGFVKHLNLSILYDFAINKDMVK